MYIRNAWVFGITESICEFIQYGFFRHLIGINVHCLIIKKIKSTDIIQSGNMIFVWVGKNNCIQFFYTGYKHLASEIRRRINNYGSIFTFNKYAGTKSFVLWIWRGADITFTGNHRYAATGTRT